MVLWKKSGSFSSTRLSEMANRHTVSFEGSSILDEDTVMAPSKAHLEAIRTAGEAHAKAARPAG